MPHPSEQQLSLFPIQDYDLEMPWSFLDGAETWAPGYIRPRSISLRKLGDMSLEQYSIIRDSTVPFDCSGIVPWAQAKEKDNGNR